MAHSQRNLSVSMRWGCSTHNQVAQAQRVRWGLPRTQAGGQASCVSTWFFFDSNNSFFFNLLMMIITIIIIVILNFTLQIKYMVVFNIKKFFF